MVLPHGLDILLNKVLLELGAGFAVITSIVNVKNELARADSLDEPLELSVIRVRRVGHLVIEGHVAVVLIVPACQDDEDGGLFLVASVYTARIIKRR